MFSIQLLNEIRDWEIERIARHFRPGARILEVGAGTGRQALWLSQRSFTVEAVEIPDSRYAQDRVFHVTDYDGRTIPFPDDSFDIVFSSNVLEHIPDLPNIHTEIRRVLRHDGYVVHVLPTHFWRIYSS